MKTIKQHLCTPGPTEIPPQVFAAMGQPTLHHRTPVFERIFKSALERYQSMLGGEHETIFLACSGSGAMEASLANAVKAGDTIIYVNAGKFGERWGEIGQALALKTIEIKAVSGTSPTLEVIERTLRAHPEAKAFCVQYTESSTALLHPVPEISALVKRVAPEMLILVDAISALATLEIPLAKLPIDILIGASQKALMLPPGLAMISISPRAWDIIEANPRRSLYFDLPLERKAHKKSTSAWTPAMNIICGLESSLTMLADEGFDNVYRRHAIAAEAARSGILALGLTLLSPDHPAPGVTAALVPDKIDGEKMRDFIFANCGIQLAGGQEELKGRIIRIGHMGYMNAFDVLVALSGIELGLEKFGHTFERGVAVRAAQQVVAMHGGVI